MWGNRWDENWQEKQKYLEKTCPSATSSTTNPTLPDLGSNRGTAVGNRWLTAWAISWPNVLSIFFYLDIGGWSPYWVHLALRSLLAYCTCPGWSWGWRSWWNERFWQGKPKYSEKTYPDATLSTTNPNYETRARTQAVAVGSERLTASAMARLMDVVSWGVFWWRDVRRDFHQVPFQLVQSYSGEGPDKRTYAMRQNWIATAMKCEFHCISNLTGQFREACDVSTI
jgi:hypothetical protein